MDAIRLVRLALAVLTDRLVTLLALIMTFGLAAWAMQEPSNLRAVMAGFFALAVFLPCLFKERTKSHDRNQGASDTGANSEG
jgi:hypothetical protein